MSTDLKRRYKRFRRKLAVYSNHISTFYLRQIIFKGRFLRMHNMLQVLALFVGGYFIIKGFIETILLGGVIGPWYIPCVLAYILLFIFAKLYLQKRKYKMELRAYIGDEEYYKCYPKELERDIRKLERSISLWQEEEETSDRPLSLDRPLTLDRPLSLAARKL